MLKDGKVAMQGGVKNYLGKKKTVTVPKDWQSSPDHPTTKLAYITKAEKDLLLKKDLHNSLNGKPNRGPSGVMSLNGWGSGEGDRGQIEVMVVENVMMEVEIIDPLWWRKRYCPRSF